MNKTAFDAGVEAALEKLAFDPITQGVGYLVGKTYGREQKERGEKHRFGVPQAAASLLIPGGAGYQVGRYVSHNQQKKKKKKD